jgi:hypothetical protein
MDKLLSFAILFLFFPSSSFFPHSIKKKANTYAEETPIMAGGYARTKHKKKLDLRNLVGLP